MTVDPSNPVVALCAEGMMREGTPDAARECFERAWALRRDDYDASIAAHFLARHQPSPSTTLEWNERALLHAELAGEHRTREFLPSLLLNVGDALLVAGRVAEASRMAARARESVRALPEGGYRAFVDRGIAALMDRIAAATVEPVPDPP